MDDPERRPPLTGALSGTEFRRWYWLKEELLEFARSRGIPPSGGKEQLASRIAASLDGLELPHAPSRRRATPQLAEPLTSDVVIPAGQRCSQTLRAWFEREIGPSFSFDAAMREFIGGASGSVTLADAVAHWHVTRDSSPLHIGEQFEYNRFTRRWHEEDPTRPRAEMLDAWREYRALPLDQRGRA